MMSLRALTITASLLCGTLAASAQTFSGLGPARSMVLPPTAGAAAARAASETATETASQRPLPVPPLRRLPSPASSLRLVGENAQIVWTLYVTQAEARAGGRFQIGHLSAISALPEASSLTLSLNGTNIGTTPIDAAKGLQSATFEVAPGRLAHGFNEVRISAVQRHRVDCSVAATYELWTQIDPDTTGFVPAVEAALEPPDLAAIAAAADGATPIRLIQSEARLSERGVDRLLGALQDVVLAGRYPQPSVAFSAGREEGRENREGLALAIGTSETLGRSVDLTALGPVSGPKLALLPATMEQRATLVLTGTSEAEVEQALGELGRLRAASPAGTPSGLRALADAKGRSVEGGQSLSLSELGFGDAHVEARTHRIAFDLALPHDFLAADYDRISFDLDAAYAAGLAPGAKILIDVNGLNAASTPLARSRGESAGRRTLFLPLRLLRPGLNQFVITAEVPVAADEACRSSESAAAERLTLFATSRLTIPPLARIAPQPDLAETLAAGFPYVQSARRTTLRVPAPDRDSMAAAATLVARLAVAAGRPIPFAFAATRGATEGPTVIVAPAPLLDLESVQAAGLDPLALQAAWSGREALAAAKAGPATARRSALRRDAIASCRARPLVSAAKDAAGSETAPATAIDLGGASAALSQAVTGPGKSDIVTLVTAPSAAALREAVDCLSHPLVWNRPQGRLAALSAADGTVVNTSEDAVRYVSTAEPSLMNLRRIAAGWLSLHAGLYGVLALLVAGSLAGSTQLLVRNLGRRSSK